MGEMARFGFSVSSSLIYVGGMVSFLILFWPRFGSLLVKDICYEG